MRMNVSFRELLEWFRNMADYMISVCSENKKEYWRGRKEAINVLIESVPDEVYEVLDVGLSKCFLKNDITHIYGKSIGAEDLLSFKSKWCERIPPLNGHSRFRCRECPFSYATGYCSINKYLNKDKDRWVTDET